MAVKSLSLSSRHFQRLCLIGLPGFWDGGNVDIVSVEECQQFSDFAATSIRTLSTRLNSVYVHTSNRCYVKDGKCP